MKTIIIGFLTVLLLGNSAYATSKNTSKTGNSHSSHQHINSEKNSKIVPAFDLVYTAVKQQEEFLIFQHRVVGTAGEKVPKATGKLNGAGVESYVWPLSLDSSAVGFEKNQGILALVATSHPDFDDTPLYDEDGDGNPKNDGREWHSHWVVLVQDAQCGEGALKVKDIPEGSTPKLPKTWPELPLLIDSPGYDLDLSSHSIKIKIPLLQSKLPLDFKYDGVTAALRVNANLHNPLLCVVNVYDIASGDLSLPGIPETN